MIFDAGISHEFAGYACIFNEQDLGNDIILPNAFNDCLMQNAPPKISMLWQHDPNQPIGVWQSIEADHKGIYVIGKLSVAIEKSRDISAMIKEGIIDGLSIGFKTKRATQKNNHSTRLIHALELWEISIVTFPMQLGARIVPFDAKEQFANSLAGAAAKLRA